MVGDRLPSSADISNCASAAVNTLAAISCRKRFWPRRRSTSGPNIHSPSMLNSRCARPPCSSA